MGPNDLPDTHQTASPDLIPDPTDPNGGSIGPAGTYYPSPAVLIEHGDEMRRIGWLSTGEEGISL